MTKQTMASRAAMEAYLKQSGAHLWIEHDPETFNRLKKAPDYIEKLGRAASAKSLAFAIV
jgi:hypothetical protein